MVTLVELNSLGWGVNGEAWKWRKRMFAWEEELVGECVELFISFIFQVNMVDRWVWKL